MNLLDKKALDFLKNRKNLLAFSGGIDSSALFFLLLENRVDFDIAIVNYKLRKESDIEVEYAKELAKKYDKKIFIKTAPISPPSIEKKARDIRYSFFKKIILENGYGSLITAHQLNDQLEWFFMRFTKGAGLVELLGMEPISKREGYFLVRPILFIPKSKLKEYLDKNGIKYFFDISNLDISFERNYFRKEFSEKLMQKYEKGIKRSFEYLHKDREFLLNQLKFKNIKELYIAKKSKDDLLNIRVIDKIFKKLGYLLSHEQKKELLRQRCGVIGGKIAVCLTDKFIFIAPYIDINMEKEFKEECRVSKIPPKIRGYIYKNSIDLDTLKAYMQQL